MNKRGRVLVVDDDPIVLEVTRDRLESAGYEVLVHDRGLGTSSIILRERPEVVLLDVMMPGLPGDELAEIIMGSQLFENEKIHFILCSSKPKDVLDKMVEEVGALGAIHKTSDDDEFLRQFKRLVEKTRSIKE